MLGARIKARFIHSLSSFLMSENSILDISSRKVKYLSNTVKGFGSQDFCDVFIRFFGFPVDIQFLKIEHNYNRLAQINIRNARDKLS